MGRLIGFGEPIKGGLAFPVFFFSGTELRDLVAMWEKVSRKMHLGHAPKQTFTFD